MLPRQANGFTLIEMLIAITLLGVMVTLLFGSLRIAAQSWHSGETKIDQVNRKAVVYQFFKHHLGSARPLPEFTAADRDETQNNTDQVPLKLSFQGCRKACVSSPRCRRLPRAKVCRCLR